MKLGKIFSTVLGLLALVFLRLANTHTLSDREKMNEPEIEKLLKEITFVIYDKKYDQPTLEDVVCSAFAIASGPSNVEDIFLSAGHCFGAQHYRDRLGAWGKSSTISYFLYSRRLSGIDFLIGTKPTEGTMYAKYPRGIVSELPRRGEICYTLGLDASTGKRGLAKLQYVNTENFYMKFKLVGGYPVIERVSGSPVVNQYGEIVGIEVAINEKDHSIVRVTSASSFITLVNAIGDMSRQSPKS